MPAVAFLFDLPSLIGTEAFLEDLLRDFIDLLLETGEMEDLLLLLAGVTTFEVEEAFLLKEPGTSLLVLGFILYFFTLIYSFLSLTASDMIFSDFLSSSLGRRGCSWYSSSGASYL